MSIKELICAKRARRAQIALEAVAFVVAAGLVSWSAVVAKRSGGMPAAAAVTVTEPVRSAPMRAEREAPVVIPVAAQVVEEVPVAAAVVEEGAQDAGVFTPEGGYERYFDGRPLVRDRVIYMEVTGYSPDHRSCGIFADGITASGKSVWTNGMQLVAADTRHFPFGTLMSIPGYANDSVVPVLDRGGAIKGMKLDLLYATHERALQWGRQRVPVVVWRYADE